jgi:ubiquitin-protein ligase
MATANAANAATNTTITITKDSIRRILSDVREIMSCPLTDSGIYYVHDEEDVLLGHAMLYGMPDTAYAGGYYFFRIKFPPDYPHAPLTVTFLTNDGTTRMHPNFYKTGYVCLSILNNWKGEQWTGCLTLKSVLLTMVSIMDDKPMLHEPGIRETHADFLPYHRIIEYKTIEFACCRLLNDVDFNRYIVLPDTCRSYFYALMRELFKVNHERILDRARALKDKYAINNNNNNNNNNNAATARSNVLSVAIYGMQSVLNYDALFECVNSVIKNGSGGLV